MSAPYPVLLLALAVSCATCPAQQNAAAHSPSGPPITLGPDDQLSIWALGLPEIDKPVRISPSGYIDLPMLGRVQAAGLTIDQLRKELTDRLEKYVNGPEVSISVVELHSRPVSVIGSVKTPGVHQIGGPTSLLEVLSLAGGALPEAGNVITITRRVEFGRIPLANAKPDSTGQFSVAGVNLNTLVEGKQPAENLMVQPYDVISVPKAQMIYVMGEVNKPGGFVLSDAKGFSALQAVSLAGGLAHGAAAKNAKVLRAGADSDRAEMKLNLQRVIDGKEHDMTLKPDDILYVPGSASKSASIRAIEAAIQVGTGVVIWRR